MLSIIQIAAAVASSIAPFTPYLVEAAKGFAGKGGEAAWKKAEELWSRLTSDGDNVAEIKAAAKALSKDVDDSDFGSLLTSAIERHLETRPNLVHDLSAILGGELAVQEILAQDRAVIRGVRQQLEGRGRQSMKASGKSKIQNATQIISDGSKPKRK